MTPPIFWIGVALMSLAFLELWLSTRKGGSPSASFWALLAVVAGIAYWGLTK
jgi:hypothetical protein